MTTIELSGISETWTEPSLSRVKTRRSILAVCEADKVERKTELCSMSEVTIVLILACLKLN